MAATKFQAVLERPEGVGTWTYLAIPFDASSKYGSRGQTKVKGTIDGALYKSTLLPRGDGKHYLVVPRPIREKIGVGVGAQVTVIMEMDRKVRKVDVPRDLSAALKKVRGATAAFRKLAASHQKEYIEWIESAKRPDTRKRRIEKAIEMVTHGGKVKR